MNQLRLLPELIRMGTARSCPRLLYNFLMGAGFLYDRPGGKGFRKAPDQTIPCASMALTTFRKPAMLAPAT